MWGEDYRVFILLSRPILYLHRYILVQLAPKVNPNSDDNRLACEMSSSRMNVHHPPFCFSYVWFHDSAGRRDSRDSNQVRTTRYGIIIHFCPNLYTCSHQPFNPSLRSVIVSALDFCSKNSRYISINWLATENDLHPTARAHIHTRPNRTHFSHLFIWPAPHCDDAMVRPRVVKRFPEQRNCTIDAVGRGGTTKLNKPRAQHWNFGQFSSFQKIFFSL